MVALLNPWRLCLLVVMTLSCSEDEPDASRSAAGEGGASGSPSLELGGAKDAGGTAAGQTTWTCGSGYDLASYDGEQEGLCSPDESMWRICCEGDIGESYTVRCAPDGSICLAGSYCTTLTYECGWQLCIAEGEGGAGGGANGDLCDPETVESLESLTPCASDEHCSGGQVCNRRAANRMFCADPN